MPLLITTRPTPIMRRWLLFNAAQNEPGPNDYVQAGVDNAKAALTAFSTQDLSTGCKAFLDQLGAGAPVPFTSGSLQAQAGASASFVYDGASSPTKLSDVGYYNEKGTIGDSFKGNQNLNALSPQVGNVIFVRSAMFASSTTDLQHPYAYIGANGKPTGFAIGEMAHEMMHKFKDLHPGLENRLGPMYVNAVRSFGSMAVSVAIMHECE
jgi:hypothetical protein